MQRGDAALQHLEPQDLAPSWEAPTGVLLLADASPAQRGVARALGLAGFIVVSETSETSAWRSYDSRIILAMNSSFERLILVCMSLRIDGFTGALVVSVEQATALQQASILNAGADDVLPTAITPELFAARLRAVQRRLAPGTALLDPRLTFVASGKACGVIVRGRNITLTPIETRLLTALVQARGAVIKLADLRRIASPDAPLSSACLPVHITQLRKKLADEGSRIHNQRGVGYAFLDPDLGGLKQSGTTRRPASPPAKGSAGNQD